ncbi:MAG TPA: hypothetical protein VMI73_22725 [Trebonia sp.]|nr:hypothetical protein [Trebonia sp.]
MADTAGKATVEMLKGSGVRWVYGMTLCALGLAPEFRQGGIASNAL